ncbi:hypothetical protein OG948_54685 (plasmid) [Embleya sp. NBC_00888]|nr:hypothetical protein OG948_54685 [Embleya sp. NBC_00888]
MNSRGHGEIETVVRALLPPDEAVLAHRETHAGEVFDGIVPTP